MELKVGDIVKRADVHAAFGGRTQGRLSPSKSSANVFLFLDPQAQESAGEICGVTDDGCLHVAGEGLSGDQKIKSANYSIANHTAEGRALRVFVKTGNDFRYVGEYSVAVDMPFYRVDAPDTADFGVVRDGYVFRLEPEGEVGFVTRSRLAEPYTGDIVVTRRLADPAPIILGSRQPFNLEATAATLASEFAQWIAAQGGEPVTLDIVPDDSSQKVVVPLFDEAKSCVIYPCGSTSRDAIRSAIGGVIDAKRLAHATDAVLLMPAQPREDVMRLVEYIGVIPAWPLENGWQIGADIWASERKPTAR
jgi:hypothetical protein